MFRGLLPRNTLFHPICSPRSELGKQQVWFHGKRRLNVNAHRLKLIPAKVRIRTVWCVCGEEEGCPAPRRRKTRPLSRNEPFWSQAAPLVVTLLKSKWALFNFKHGYSLSKSHLSGVCLPLNPPPPPSNGALETSVKWESRSTQQSPMQTPFCVSLLPFWKQPLSFTSPNC